MALLRTAIERGESLCIDFNPRPTPAAPRPHPDTGFGGGGLAGYVRFDQQRTWADL
jgi:hypothetical protein